MTMRHCCDSELKGFTVRNMQYMVQFFNYEITDFAIIDISGYELG